MDGVTYADIVHVQFMTGKILSTLIRLSQVKQFARFIHRCGDKHIGIARLNAYTNDVGVMRCILLQLAAVWDIEHIAVKNDGNNKKVNWTLVIYTYILPCYI